MAKTEWLYCNGDWSDIINIIKLEKNCDERLREFHDILKREKLTVDDVIDEWAAVEKEAIEECAKDWFYDCDLISATISPTIYWFFNVYTGEAIHIKYSVHVTSNIVID